MSPSLGRAAVRSGSPTTITRTRHAVALMAATASLAACGTTVAHVTGGRSTSDGLAQATTQGAVAGASADSPNASTRQGATGALGAGGTQLSGPSAGAQASGGAVPLSGAAGSQVPVSGPVEVGFLVTKCSNCDLLGAGYVAPAHSEQDVLQALVNDVNQRGGLLGHKIVPVWGVEDTASSDFSTMMQSICAAFTQDHHVIAVLGAGVGYEDILSQCLAKAGVVAFDATRSTGVPDDQDLSTHPGYVVSSEPSANVYSLVAITSTVSDGWVTPRTKLGVLNFTCPEGNRVWANTVEPYLASHGLTVAVHSTISCPAGASDLGSAAQAVQSAELKMHASGVDTVVITDIPLVVFAEDAESQHWYPHYVASEGGAMYQAYLTADQLKNIHSAGWEPTYDLDAQHQSTLTPSQHECLDALTRGGFNGAVASEYTAYFSLCGGLDLYERAIAGAKSLSSPLVLRATDALSDTFVSPMLLGGRTLLAQGRHAAAVQYRSIVYDTTCSCFTYQGPVRQLPATH